MCKSILFSVRIGTFMYNCEDDDDRTGSNDITRNHEVQAGPS